jgi:Ca2+-binding RTX toxin-like protein
VHVADLPQTGFLVAWTDDLSGGQTFGSGSAIRGRLYSQLGAAIGEEFAIATYDGRVLRDPAAAGMPNGKFVVAWTQDDSGPDGAFENNIYARIFGPAGKGGDPFLLHEGTAGQQTAVALEAFGPNRFIAAWTDQAGPKFTIHARILNGDGTPWTDEFIVNTEDGTAPRFPAIAVLQEATGPRFVISWVGNEGTLKGQIFDPARGALGIDFYGSERPEAYAAQLDEHVLHGNGGSDTLTGSAGRDTLSGGAARDALDGGAGADLLNGGIGNDGLSAGGGDDRLLGAQGNDTLDGGAGNDTATGGNGNDNIIGNAGNDVLGGEAGGETLTGGPGADRLTGGVGGDRFDFNAAAHSPVGGRDTVVDFAANAGDRIDLSTVDADPGAPGNQAFDFITSLFTGAGGEVRFTTAGGHGLLSADVNGDKAADLSILLLGVTSFAEGSLIL